MGIDNNRTINYEYIEKVFEARINRTSYEIDYNMFKLSTLEKIKANKIKKTNIFTLFYEKISYYLQFINVKKIEFQMVCFAVVLCFSVLCFQYFKPDISAVKNTTDIFAIRNTTENDTSNTIITSIKGDVPSIMIFESKDKKMTVIWYKEV